MTHDVFISYADEDKSVADTICTALEAERIRCWIAPRDLVPGNAYPGQIAMAIEQSHAMVLLFSSNSNTSAHVLREVQLAADAGLKVLNFKIEDIAPSHDIKYYLSVLQWLDATTPPLEQHLTPLVRSLRERLKAANGSPVPPRPPATPPVASPAPPRPPATPRVDRAKKILLGSIFALACLACLVAIFVAYESTDPFLVYYLVSVLVVVGWYWAALKLYNGETQTRAAKCSFMLVGAMVTAAVLWRAMNDYFFVLAPHPDNKPLRLYETSNYLPYFALLGIGVMTIIWVIYANTQKPPNTENRSSILSYFIGSCVYLAVCRLAWHLVDSITIAKVPKAVFEQIGSSQQ